MDDRKEIILGGLPQELWARIMQFLGVRDLISLGQTCAALSALAQYKGLWKEFAWNEIRLRNEDAAVVNYSLFTFGVEDWKTYYKDLMNRAFDIRRCSDYISLSNNDRTCDNPSRAYGSVQLREKVATVYPPPRRSDYIFVIEDADERDMGTFNLGAGVGIGMASMLDLPALNNDISFHYAFFGHGVLYQKDERKQLYLSFGKADIVTMRVNWEVGSIHFLLNFSSSPSAIILDVPNLATLHPTVSVSAARVTLNNIYHYT